MNIKQLGLLAVAILVSFPWLTQAQETQFEDGRWVWDPIACYKSVMQLSLHYSGRLVAECFLVPALICNTYDESVLCLEDASNKATTFIGGAKANLPPSLPMTGIWPGYYGRALDGISLHLPPGAWCTEIPDLTSEVCAFINLGKPTMDAFRAARLAGVETGFAPHRRLELAQTSVSSELNPINCLAVASTLDKGYRFSFGPKCITIAEQICRNDEDGEGCVVTHIDSMREFVTSARPRLDAPTGLNSDEREYYLYLLDGLDQQIKEIPMCDGEVDLTVCEFVSLAVATIQIFEIANMASPQFADGLVGQ